jgi:hypothetical protein
MSITIHREIRRGRLSRKAKSFALDLFEDSCEYIVLLIFIFFSIVATKGAITAARAISGEIPYVLECRVYLAEVSLLLKYIMHTYRTM